MNKLNFVYALILFFLLLGLALETLAKLIYRRIAKKRPLAHKAVQFLITEDDRVFGKFIPRNFGLYWNRGDYFVDGIRQTNPQGYRSHQERIFEKQTDVFKILVLGSSTTYSDHYSLDPTTSWPLQLEDYLKSRGIQKIEVVNAGLNYATSAELLSHYIFFASRLKPNLVIIDGPGNDFLPIAAGDMTQDYSQTRKTMLLLPRRGERLILKSNLVRLAYLFLVSIKNLIILEPQNHNHNTEEANRNLMSNHPTAFQGNINTLAELLLGQKIPLVIVDFLRPSNTNKFYPISWQGIEAFDKKCRQIFKETALEFGALHIEKDDFDFPDSAFIDSCHLTLSFERTKAEIIGEKLILADFFASE